MPARNWTLRDRSLSFVPPDGGNITVQWQCECREQQPQTFRGSSGVQGRYHGGGGGGGGKGSTFF